MLALTDSEIVRWAFWVAIASAVFSGTALFWSIRLHFLLGPRLVVRLTPGVLTEVGHLIRGPEKGWRGGETRWSVEAVGNRPWMEVALIRVTNFGRTAVSVSDLALDFGTIPRWKPWARYTIAGTPVQVHEGAATAMAHRLDTGQSVTVICDLWELIAAARKDRSDVTLRVRGSALPAGRRTRRIRSSRSRRWKIRPADDSLWPHGPNHEQLLLFRAVWRSVVYENPKAVYNAWIGVAALTLARNQRPSVQEFADVLRPYLGEAQAMLAAGSLRMVMR